MEYSFLIDMMSTFYDFWTGLATMLNYSLTFVAGQVNNTGGCLVVWHNPFTSSMSSFIIDKDWIGNAFLVIEQYYNLIGVDTALPIWQCFLLGILPTFFILVIIRAAVKVVGLIF